MNLRTRRLAAGALSIGLWARGVAFAQPQSTIQVKPLPFCRASEALSLFALTVRQVLKAEHREAWPVFQVPCDALPGISDTSPTAILVVDRSSATDQDVLQYGFTPFPFVAAVAVTPQPDDVFARLGRWILEPSLSAVPSIWTRGQLDAGRAEALRLALAAGAIQSLAGSKDALCSTGSSHVPEQLLTAAEAQSRSHPDYHLYFEAALLEHRVIVGQQLSLVSLAKSVAQDLTGVVVPRLRCDLGNKDLFSLMPFGADVTSLTKTAEHIEHALSGLRKNGRSDLGQLNLARACALQAVNDMLQSNRVASCNNADYGLWTRAYAPLLHAAQVKVLQTSR